MWSLYEFMEAKEETTLCGDVDAFMVYFESGSAEMDWNDRLMWRQRQFEKLRQRQDFEELF